MPERYQDEIEEILRQAGESPPDEASRDLPRADDQVVALFALPGCLLLLRNPPHVAGPGSLPASSCSSALCCL